MPIPPRPSTFSCPKCHWHATTLPASDALCEGRDWFSTCPACRNTNLEVRAATQLEIFKAKLFRPFS
ncbi:hypothetical protein QTN23_23970 [Pseudomonas shirazica]|uniref:Uncharacterized protein n=1 Tax=Pseudomonas aeruginosa TaxID=287 RepID=A0ABD7JXT9_PSEAI|nr:MULTISPECIES: hypothetical protein [Pseudomonas]RTR93293.1 hypothetical protein DY932_24250 [Pseudomonas paraeruginosa]MCE1080142.1 hypothetical protein [Pseudomonas asiatica]MDM9597116.1 hypothetical protein [Pseudomonas shirazica]MDO2415926.1 hypothetical protein [Pseudomonas shirazica]OPE07025.1 hypothetical protein APA44_32950 [Pseudomonas aeruginosa]